jgi:hypothetical protein
MSEKQLWHLKIAYSVTYTAQNIADNTEWYVAKTHCGYRNSDTCIAMKNVDRAWVLSSLL